MHANLYCLPQLFAEFSTKFPYFNCTRVQRVKGTSEIGQCFRVAMVLLNMGKCIEQTSFAAQYYDCAPPTIEEYIAMADPAA